jgi:Ulp1 family protease
VQVRKYLQDRAFDRKGLKNASLTRLTHTQWLDDEVINNYGDLIMARRKEAEQAGKLDGLKDVFWLNSFFYTQVSTHGYQKVRRWTKKVGCPTQSIKSL